MPLTNLDKFTVMNAEPGKRYTVHNPETGKMEVVRCEQHSDVNQIYFTLDSCPKRWIGREDGRDYAKIYQHIRPADSLGIGDAAVNARETFSIMLARKAYRIG